MQRILPACSVILLFGSFLAGCGGAPYRVAPVSGRITLDGEPLANGVVTFQPIADPEQSLNAGPGSYGHTDAEGRYTLYLVEGDRPGAVVGPHRVRISAAQENPDDDPAGAGTPLRDPVPAKYRDGSLSYTVTAKGSSAAVFDLHSP